MRSATQRGLYVLAAAVILGFGALVWHRLSIGRADTSQTRPLPLVEVIKPFQVDMERKLQLTANILPIQQADLMAKVAGYLDAIYVDRGDHVRAGQVLAVIRQPELEHQLRRAKASYDLAKVTYRRLHDLFGKQLIAQQEMDDARTKFDIAKRELALQQAYVDYAKILAPFDGYVTKRLVDPGALIPQSTGIVSAGNTLMTVMDLSQVKVFINIPERDVASIHVGDHVALTVDAYPDQTFRGHVTRFAPALDPATRTLEVEIDIVNTDMALKPGMFARVTIALERHAHALTVPAEALLVNEMGSFLYVVGPPQDDSPTVHRTAVRTGIEDGGQVEILAGLGAGTQIVRTGKELVHDGSRVRISEDGTASTTEK